MNNINLKQIKPQFMAQVILALRGDEHIFQKVADVRLRFGITNKGATKADFYDICKSEDIFIFDNIKEIHTVRGVYMYLRTESGKEGRAIGISTYLSKRNYLKVAFHELGHHFLHRPNAIKHYFREPLTLNYFVREAQANFFSDLMLSEVKDDAEN